jgi:hypothetical protein
MMWKYRSWPIAKSAGTSFVLVQKGTRETPTHTHTLTALNCATRSVLSLSEIRESETLKSHGQAIQMIAMEKGTCLK